MKRNLLILAFLSLCFIGARDPAPTFQFTIVNKSGMEIAIKLVELHEYEAYYLPVALGTRRLPEKVYYAIDKGVYDMYTYYIEIYDPVYGTKCDQDPSSSVIAFYRNKSVTVVECNTDWK